MKKRFKGSRFLRVYWPLLAVAPVVAIIHGILVEIGDPWSAGEWASNIIFAYVITVATVVLSRRQGKLQEALADAELIEKIAVVAGAVDHATTQCHPSTVRQLFLDARSGLHLLPFAEDMSRIEYLETVHSATSMIHGLVTGSVRPYTLWTAQDWNSIQGASQRLRETLALRVRQGREIELQVFKKMQNLLRELEMDHGQGDCVPFGSFEKSFRYGDVGQRVRSMLNWELLRDHVESGTAKICLRREWSVRWLEKNTIYSVWYTTGTGEFARFDQENVVPIELNRIDDYHDRLPIHSKATIDSMARWLEVRPDGILRKVEIVTMRLSQNVLLVLDGNHRVAAIQHKRHHNPLPISVNIVEYQIAAPLDSSLLPDLRHHRS